MASVMQRRCAKCGVTPAKDTSVSYHRFPKPGCTNILRATAWATYCYPDKDWSSLTELQSFYKKCRYLCGRHFEEHCYIDNTKKRLRLSSVPGTNEQVRETLDTLRAKIPVLAKKHARELEECPAQNLSSAGSSTQTSDLNFVIPDNPSPNVCPHNTIVQAFQHDHCYVNISLNHESLCPAGQASQLDMANASSSLVSGKPSKGKKKSGGILKCINKRKVSELTETEKKLYVVCRNKSKKIHKMKLKLSKKKIETLCENENVQQLLDLKLSKPFINLLQSQLHNSKRKVKGRRYNIDQKLLALSLYKKSPACYRLLRRMFTLPSQSSLNKLLNRVPMKPGINPHIFEGLKSMAQNQSDNDNLCTLIFDEMSIRKHLQYNIKIDAVYGFQDHGNHGRSETVASNALVFMLSGIRKRWKQPVAFYLSGKSTTADRLAILVSEVLTECFKAGLSVVSTVCDMSAVNTRAIRNLGATTEKPYFMHEGREIVTIADPPHLLKCTRNMFISHDIEITAEIQPNGTKIKGIAKWDHIKQFYNLDQMNQNFVYAPALTEKHINPNARQKMRVNLAAQVFSHTVTAGILTKVATCELPMEATATATLLKKFDGLFDCLNANSADARRGKKLSTNLTHRSPHLQYFKDMKMFISDMHFLNSRNPPSQSGWIQTINAVERLWNNITKLGIQSCSTRRLNQDPLENFFGCVRYNSGSNYNPTTSQFISGVKSAIITNLKNSGINKNCEDDDGLLNNNLKHFLSADAGAVQNIVQKTIHNDLENYDTPEMDQYSSEIQACAYVCGFIAKKNKNNCATCDRLLRTEPGSEPAHLFTQMKEYEDNHSLQYVSINFIKAVERASVVIKKYFGKNMHKQDIRERGVLLLKTECGQDLEFLKTCDVHYNNLCHKIFTDIFYINLKRTLVLKNRALSEEDGKKAMERKMKILKNI